MFTNHVPPIEVWCPRSRRCCHTRRLAGLSKLHNSSLRIVHRGLVFLPGKPQHSPKSRTNTCFSGYLVQVTSPGLSCRKGASDSSNGFKSYVTNLLCTLHEHTRTDPSERGRKRQSELLLCSGSITIHEAVRQRRVMLSRGFVLGKQGIYSLLHTIRRIPGHPITKRSLDSFPRGLVVPCCSA